MWLLFNKMILKEHTANDVAALTDLMQIADNRTQEWATERIVRYLNERDGKTIFVAEENNDLLGYVGIKEVEENIETRRILGQSIDNLACITWVAVHPQFRKRGIATALLKHCEVWAKNKKKEGIWLDCREKILPLYENAGYKISGSYQHQGSARYVLIKQI